MAGEPSKGGAVGARAKVVVARFWIVLAARVGVAGLGGDGEGGVAQTLL